jgi:hypothetical protein
MDKYCFDLAWKTTKDYMEASGFVLAAGRAILACRSPVAATHPPKVQSENLSAVCEPALQPQPPLFATLELLRTPP